MDNSNAALIAPAIVNRTVLRRPNAELRTREHLTVGEVEQLIECASTNRQGPRDALMILPAFRHGLRAAEVWDLRWEQIDFAAATLHVRRIKHGTPATHPLTGREMRALRKHQREASRSAFVFASERSAPLSAPGFSRMVSFSARQWSPAPGILLKRNGRRRPLLSRGARLRQRINKFRNRKARVDAREDLQAVERRRSADSTA